MLSSSLLRSLSKCTATRPRSIATLTGSDYKQTAMDVFKNSCYNKIDYKINENSTAKEAAIRYTSFNISCLVVVNDQEKMVGVVSGRDYINKVAATERDPLTTKIKDICTYSPKIMVARESESLEQCMYKMRFVGTRHLVLMNDANTECIGLISIRDLVNEIIKNQRETITRLSDFNLGKGAFFGSE